RERIVEEHRWGAVRRARHADAAGRDAAGEGVARDADEADLVAHGRIGEVAIDLVEMMLLVVGSGEEQVEAIDVQVAVAVVGSVALFLAAAAARRRAIEEARSSTAAVGAL